MRKILILVCIISSFAACHSQTGVFGVVKNTTDTTYTPPPPSTDTTIQWSGKTVVFIGNSITYGVGASSPANRWSTLFSAAKGAVENNQGFSGRVLQQGNTAGLNTMDLTSTTIVPIKTPSNAAIIMALGTNDIGINNNGIFSSSGYRTRLEAFVDTCVARGWNARQVIILTPFYVTQDGLNRYMEYGISSPSDSTIQQNYVNAAITAATNKGTRYVDIFTLMKNTTDIVNYIGDGIHPNDAGHLLIKNYLVANLP